MAATSTEITPSHAQTWWKSWLPYIIVFIIWDIYLYLSLTSPILNASRLGLSEDAIAYLRLSVALPYLIIWLAATYATTHLARYVSSLGKNLEGKSFRLLTIGVGILTVAFITVQLLGVIRNFIPHQAIKTDLTIITNYLYVFPYLGAFLCFFTGVNRLSGSLQIASVSWKKWWYWLALLTIFTYAWLDLIFSNPTRSVGTPTAPASYYIKDSLIVLTIVIPSIITWSSGILTMVKLRHYYLHVKGSIYRQALSWLVIGFGGVIAGSIILQAFLALGTGRLLALGLNNLLGIVYLFMLLQVAGFVYVARGTKRLTNIETV